MTQAQALNDAAMVILTAIFWVSLFFPIVVGTFWKWWRTAFGNSYVWMAILLATATSGPAVREMFGVDPEGLWFQWCVVLALALIPVVIHWRTWVLWSEQRRGKTLNPVVAIRDWYRAKRTDPDRDKETVR